MKKSDLVECIRIGYKEGDEVYQNSDNDDFIESEPMELPIKGNEAQFAWELGYDLGNNAMGFDEELIDEYLEEILYNCDSPLTLEDLE